MKKEALTAKQVQHMKPDPEKRLEVPAGPPIGLYLVVHPTGRKSWAFRYRWEGCPKKLTFEKAYPDLMLAAARAEAESALADLDQDIDPAARKAEEQQAKLGSVERVVQEFIKRKVTGTKTHAEVERILRREILSAWKHRNISDIGRPDVLRLLDSISDRKAPAMANKTLSVIKRLFSWCAERGEIEISPVDPIKAPNKEKSRDRVLTDAELADVWNAAGGLGYPLGPLYRFLILTAQRRGEVAKLEWLDVSLDTGLWTLPSKKTKPGRLHDVPLPSMAVEVLDNLPRFEVGQYVFTTTSGEKPVNGFSKGKERLDTEIARLRRERSEDGEMEPWRVHDLRRTAATWIAGAGVPSEVLSRILNHSPGSTQGVTHIYNRFRYLQERREALEAWSKYVLDLAEKPNVSQIVSIR